MLYVFGFERIGVAVSDIYFVDPQPNKGQEGAEHGVRLEVRMLGEGELRGTVYSARPISLGLADLASGPAGVRRRAAGQLRPDPPPPGLHRLGPRPPGLRQGTVGRPARLAGRPPGRPGRGAQAGERGGVVPPGRPRPPRACPPRSSPASNAPSPPYARATSAPPPAEASPSVRASWL
ncbi:hypothetical protein ACFSTC_02550 [Nonomuraea ferruginea]